MCGIVGFIGNKNIPRLLRFLSFVEHRGRDGNATFYFRRVHMGMNRLAINDIKHNPYPLKFKQYTLVFNGEIYNYKELRKLLLGFGVSFQTTCDAEVILPLFARYKSKAFTMLEGMFAIGIYDSVTHRLILARDKSGEKPLYIMNNRGKFAFSSEIKVFLAGMMSEKQQNRRALGEYFTQGFVLPPATLVRDIEKISPSHFLIYDGATGQKRIFPYWEPLQQVSFSLAYREADPVNGLENLLQSSVEHRLLSDVPVGCFLSGGIDSSLVAYFSAQRKKNLQTYSVSFPGYLRQDESVFASMVAKQLNTHHTIIPCTLDSVAPLIDHIGELIDEPIVDPAVLPTLLMAQEARKGIKVVLTGEGADELFGGYYRYQKELAIEAMRRSIPLKYLISFLLFGKEQAVRYPLVERYRPQQIWKQHELQQLLMKREHNTLPPLYPNGNSLDPLLFLQLADYRGYMAEQLLMKIDKSTMAFNLEARAPYLDTNIIGFALGLPYAQKVRMIHGKYILKRLAERYFPTSLVWRPKHGFSVPLRDWFRTGLRSYVYQSVDDLALYAGKMNVPYYKSIVIDHMDRRADNSSKIWSVIVLTKWMRRYNIKI